MTSSLTTAHERINSILDAGSFVEIGAQVSARYSPAGECNGDGIAAGYGTVDGALVYVFAQDPAFLGGSVGEMHAKKISRIYDMAIKMKAPVIALADCAGVRLNEGNDSLFSFGCMFAHQAKASGIIPQITVVYGTCGGGMAVAASMSDFVFMEKDNGKLFVSSPNAVLGNFEGKCDTGASDYQAKETGLCDLAGTPEEIGLAVRELVKLLPHSNVDDFSFVECDDDLNRSVSGIEKLEKAEAIKQIADNGKFFEIRAEYASCVKTGFIKLNGYTVGVVANAKRELSHKACKKIIHFVNFCDAFNIPVLTLADVDGFMRDGDNEQNLARALGKLTYTYSNATVPTVTVIAGHAYGTAGVVMNSKALGADVVYAWTGSKMGLMDKTVLEGITEAVDKDINDAEYNARRGYVDDIIDPAETRQRAAAAFEMLYSKDVDMLPKKHGTV